MPVKEPRSPDTWEEIGSDGRLHLMKVVPAKFHLHRCCECAYRPEDDFQCHRDDRPCGDYQMMVRDMGIADSDTKSKRNPK